MIGNDTSRLHGADHILLLNLLHNADHQPVVHQNLVARFHRMRQVLITDGNLLLIAFHLSGGEDKGISLLQFNLVIRKRTDSIFRPLGIQHDGNRYPHALPEFLDRDDLFLMFFVCTVRKIESGDIHPRLYHLLQNFFILRGGTNGTNDLCFSHRGFLSFYNKIETLVIFVRQKSHPYGYKSNTSPVKMTPDFFIIPRKDSKKNGRKVRGRSPPCVMVILRRLSPRL